MQRQTIAVAALGLLFGTPPSLRGQERSYSATKQVVWNAVHGALSALQIAITKEDSAKGEILSEPAPTDSTYVQCQLHVGRGRPSGFWFAPKTKLEVSLKERSASETLVRIKFSAKKIDVSSGGFIGQMRCKSTGRLEEDLLTQVQSRLAAPSGKP